MGSKICVLHDRGVIELTGDDTTGFLQRLITNSVKDIPPGESRFSGLLSPQGKLLFDFFVVPLPPDQGQGYLFDCVKAQVADLVNRLNLHKLRAKIKITDRSEELGVAAILGEEGAAGADGIVFRDGRAPFMGLRLIAPHGVLQTFEEAPESDYEAHRIGQGVPKGGVDFTYGDAFVHDINLDMLNGVDFKKGCYVGQEVVARVHYRKSARKRILKIDVEGPTPSLGTPITAGEMRLGETGSANGHEALATLRLDKLEEARAAGLAIRAGEATVDVTVPPELIEAAAGVEKRL
ncbi:MAG: folate-binding protein [Alphaproteobacteria bacterium]|nr:folate-binding protein [Alphaproteobacteria bacterium]